MAKLPEDPKNTANMIFDAWEKTNDSGFRSHLGASVIGKKCNRHLWNIFRWCTKSSFPGRILKLFNRGHLEEQRFTDDLRSIGCDVMEVDADGSQWRFELFGGHFGGDTDGIIKSGVPEAPKSAHIGEYKTHGDKSFKKLVKEGVLKSKPEHYAQMMAYMGMSGVKWGAKYRIKRALYLAVNKNDDDLYSERIKYVKKEYDDLIKKAESVIFSTGPVDGISTNPSWYECKFCADYKLCHKKTLPELNCRTCVFSTPEHDGSWTCAKIHANLPDDLQRVGCSNHLYIPTALNTWLISIDGGDDWIKYEDKKTQEIWVNGKDGLTSVEFKRQTDERNT